MTVVHTGPDEVTQHRLIRTTLYDLIAAINDEVSPEEEGLVVATVMYLQCTGRLRFLRPVRNLDAQN
jgi:hypothetical protein